MAYADTMSLGKPGVLTPLMSAWEANLIILVLASYLILRVEGKTNS